MARALEIARSVAYDHQARTLLALASLQIYTGLAAEQTLYEALAAEHEARSNPAEWPSWLHPAPDFRYG